MDVLCVRVGDYDVDDSADAATAMGPPTSDNEMEFGSRIALTGVTSYIMYVHMHIDQ